MNYIIIQNWIPFRFLKLNKQVPMKTIQDFLQKQQVHQLHQKPRSKPSFRIIKVYSVNDQWQIDLIDFSNIPDGMLGSNTSFAEWMYSVEKH
jgi:hypothetical protein